MIFQEPKETISFFVGIIATALGLIPLLNTWGIIPFSIPFIGALGSTILLWFVAVAGAYLLIDSFISEEDMLMWISAIVAVVILGVAIVQILFNFNMIGFGIPFLSLTILRILFTVEGIGLLVAALLGNK